MQMYNELSLIHTKKDKSTPIRDGFYEFDKARLSTNY